MRDLRFIQPNTKESIPDDLAEAVKAFHEKGKIFNEKYKNTTTSELEYEKLKTSKNNSWKEFKHDLLTISQGRCPICESTLTKYDDIEHFRPKEHYWWLAYDYANYCIYCDLCNRNYKKSEFPLFSDFQANFDNRDKIVDEKPLLFNPVTDNPCCLFELIFATYQSTGTRLKIQALSTNPIDSYEYHKATKTIEIYNLNGEIEDKNSDDTTTRKRNAENLFADLHDLAIFWDKFKENPRSQRIEKQFFNKLKIVREIKKIDLVKLILSNNYEINKLQTKPIKK